MIETYITLKTAQLAEKVGFDEPCKRYLSEKSSPITNPNFLWSADKEISNGNLLRSQCSAPTQAFLAAWLREEHDIDVLLTISYNSEGIKVYTYDLFHKSKHLDSIGFEDGKIKYEHAYELGLFRALEILKAKQ